MDVLCLNNITGGTEGKVAEGSPTSGSSDMDDKFGDPQVLPRVGDQYQAEIPSIILAPDVSQLIKKFRDSQVTVNLPKSLELPISPLWPYCEVESSCGTLESVISEERQVISENDCPPVKLEPLTTLPGEGKNEGGFSNFQSSLKCDETGIDSHPELHIELDQAKDMYYLSGSKGESWTFIEYNSFLLGLYIFRKNLNFVKRFVGSKSTGDILSFYYGKFYRSEAYRRWSDCRRLRNKRCIFGQKIFTGWRQQELLSRLFSRMSGECHNMLVELSRNFGEGKMPFQEYVFALKNAVGIDMLIDAVGIGKGKQDLTRAAVEPTKISHIFSIRPEMPIGKACSSLTSADIIKFLTGDFRLSKARSSDLFWEAVWPRLLAKGWHSEQSKDHVVSGSKQSLVFLIPGVKKFSRRKLVKGNHYFDSVSDVLNKVASDPGLLENEIQVTDGSVDRENGQNKQNLDGFLNKQQYLYLQPLSSNCSQMKFTIVDTSIVYDSELRKVREMRSLPFQTMNISTLMNHSSSGSEQDTSEETEDRAEKTNSSSPAEEFSNKGASVESTDYTHIPDTLNAKEVAVENHECHFDLHNDDHSKEINKFKFINCTESTPMDMKLDLNESTSPSNLHDASEGLVLSVGLQNLSSPCSVAEGSPNRSNEGHATEKHLDGGVSAEKSEPRTLIDLNLPHVSPELGTEMEIPSSMVVLKNNDNQCASTSSSLYEITQLNQIQELPDGHEEQKPVIVSRRQSTRNRPLTTKALEALEYNFLNSKRKRKTEEHSHNNSKSQCLRASGGTIVSSICDNGSGNAMSDTRREEENEIREYSTSSSINLNL